jgi:hypothetical protein
MSFRSFAYALAALPLALACRPAPDDGGTDKDTTSTEGDADTDSDADSDADTDPTTSTTTTTTTTTSPSSCPTPNDLATWYGTMDASLATATNYSADAGIGALIAAGPADGMTAAVDLMVNGAIVAAIGYHPAGTDPETVWFADRNGGFRTYGIPFPGVQVGDAIALHVTEIDNYNGELEITAADGFQILSSGNSVFVQDVAGQPLDYTNQGRELVRLWGEILTDNGPCGGASNCYTVDHGGPATVDVRVGAALGLLAGDCVKVTAPLGTFGGVAQFDLSDWDWLAVY